MCSLMNALPSALDICWFITPRFRQGPLCFRFTLANVNSVSYETTGDEKWWIFTIDTLQLAT